MLRRRFGRYAEVEYRFAGGDRVGLVGQLAGHQGAAVHFQQAVMDITMNAAFRL